MISKEPTGSVVQDLKEPVDPKKLRYVEIVWYDAVQGDSWAEIHGEPDATVAKCITRGWIIREDERQIIICATISVNSDELVTDVNTSMALPKGMVAEVRDFPRKRATKRSVAPLLQVTETK